MTTKIVFCGDTFLQTRSGAPPLAKMRSRFEDAVGCLNVEAALDNTGGTRKETGVSLAVDETALDRIPDDVSILTIVNNHTGDVGDPRDLAGALRERGKLVVGPENPSVAEGEDLDDTSVAYFAAYFGLPGLRLSYDGSRADVLRELVARSTADQRLVILHWGFEHTSVPAPFQRQLAHSLVDCGADLIIGHHPHVPQGWESYNGKMIYYSLGNFNFCDFGEKPDENTRWGYTVTFDVKSGQSTASPYRINDDYQPEPMPDDERASRRSHLTRLSRTLEETDEVEWFTEYYADWYERESGRWRRRCLEEPKGSIWLKMIAWYCMPIQWKYRFYRWRFDKNGA